MTRLTILALAALAAPAAAQEAASPNAALQDWDAFHGNLAGQKYSAADQITPANVAGIEQVWAIRTGDVSDGSGDTPRSFFNSTPIYANGRLYIATAFYRILALDPATGAEIWSYDSNTLLEQLTQPGLKTRGVAYWEAEAPVEGEPCQRRILLGTNDAKIHAVDADTGIPCEEWGEGGVVDVDQWNIPDAEYPLSVLQPPTVFGEHVFTGWSGYDFRYSSDSPGSVLALDARTGELEWELDILPPEMQEISGTANVWTNMTVDEERGILYIPTSAPSPNFYGGGHVLAPLSSAVVAADVDTGEVLWSYQLVHKDIWDYDTNAAPTLVDVEVDGQMVPALVQSTKMGYLVVLNRETGEPIWPIEEVPVPQTDVPGEWTFETQPIPDWPEPVVPDEFPGIWGLADAASLGGCSRRFEAMRYEGRFTPPTVSLEPGEGSLMWPALSGGMQWGGGAYNPETGLYVINTTLAATQLRLIPNEFYAEQSGASEGDGSDDPGFYPQLGAPYGVQYDIFENWLGMPCWAPPFGLLTAYDMRTGAKVWEVPFGRSQRYGFFMPERWGAPNIGGPVLTASGLIFIGATMDGFVHAFDAATGALLWEELVAAPAIANPAVFVHGGRQYVVFTVGGNDILKPDVSDMVVAYALPE